MRRLLILAAFIVLALPLLAAEEGCDTATTTTEADPRKEAEKPKASPRERARARKRRAKRRAAARANLINTAQPIDYDQLEKDPGSYVGDKVKVYGQIFQIQQEGDLGGVMLIAVTNEGYDVWTDNVWVNYEGRVKGAKDDLITIYGTVDGEREYETQIGGQTYVPEVTAKYIEEE